MWFGACNMISMSDSKNKISFADLDTFLKVAPIIGLFILGYLQTLFPSKIEFEKIAQQLIQMDQAGKIDGTYPIFSLICIELWCRIFLDEKS